MNKKLLSTKGIELLDAKVYVLNNPKSSIAKGIIDSVNKLKVDKELKQAVVDANVSEEDMFELLVVKRVVNKVEFKKILKAIAEKLYAKIETEDKMVSVEFNDTQIVVRKKYGFTTNHFMHNFQLKKDEATALFEDGFAEQYATLKLNAFKKNFSPVLKERKTSYGMKVAEVNVTDLYHDKKESAGFQTWNRDVEILINIPLNLDAEKSIPYQAYLPVVDDVKSVLKEAKEAFYKLSKV